MCLKLLSRVIALSFLKRNYDSVAKHSYSFKKLMVTGFLKHPQEKGG